MEKVFKIFTGTKLWKLLHPCTIDYMKIVESDTSSDSDEDVQIVPQNTPIPPRKILKPNKRVAWDNVGMALISHNSATVEVRGNQINPYFFKFVDWPSPICYRSGKFGEIAIVRNLSSESCDYENTFIMKTIKSVNVRNEVKILHKVRGPRIVRMYAAREFMDCVDIVLEVCRFQSLEKIRREVGLDETKARYCLRETLKAIKYLHDLGIVHFDIKPDNILVDQRGMIKITDFNLSVQLGWNRKIFDQRGTTIYMAPELHLQRGADYKSDIFSFGISCIELTENRRIYRNLHYHKLRHTMLASPMKMIDMQIDIKRKPCLAKYIKLITSPNLSGLFLVSDLQEASEEFIDVVINTIQVNPKRRLNAEMLLRLTFFSDYLGSAQSDLVNMLINSSVDIFSFS